MCRYAFKLKTWSDCGWGENCDETKSEQAYTGEGVQSRHLFAYFVMGLQEPA